MKQFFGLAVAVIAAASTSSAYAQGRLVQQATRGVQRICVYAPSTRIPSIKRPPVLVVGVGEPCPAMYSKPEVNRVEIPSLATLKGRIFEGGRVICEYVYLNRSYRKTLSAGQSCPYTPNLF